MNTSSRDRNIRAWTLVGYYVFLTCVPVAFLLYLPNDWYYVVFKVVCGVFFVSICANLLMSQPTINYIGSAGFGFVAAAAAFGAFCYVTLPLLKVAMAFLIVTILGTCKMIIAGGGEEKVGSVPDSRADEQEPK